MPRSWVDPPSGKDLVQALPAVCLSPGVSGMAGSGPSLSRDISILVSTRRCSGRTSRCLSGDQDGLGRRASRHSIRAHGRSSTRGIGKSMNSVREFLRGATSVLPRASATELLTVHAKLGPSSAKLLLPTRHATHGQSPDGSEFGHYGEQFESWPRTAIAVGGRVSQGAPTRLSQRSVWPTRGSERTWN